MRQRATRIYRCTGTAVVALLLLTYCLNVPTLAKNTASDPPDEHPNGSIKESGEPQIDNLFKLAMSNSSEVYFLEQKLLATPQKIERGSAGKPPKSYTKFFQIDPSLLMQSARVTGSQVPAGCITELILSPYDCVNDPFATEMRRVFNEVTTRPGLWSRSKEELLRTLYLTLIKLRSDLDKALNDYMGGDLPERERGEAKLTELLGKSGFDQFHQDLLSFGRQSMHFARLSRTNNISNQFSNVFLEPEETRRQLHLLLSDRLFNNLMGAEAAKVNLTPAEVAWRTSRTKHFFEEVLLRNPDVSLLISNLTMLQRLESDEPQQRESEGIEMRLAEAVLCRAQLLSFKNTIQQAAKAFADSFNLYIDGNSKQRAKARLTLSNELGKANMAELDKDIAKVRAAAPAKPVVVAPADSQELRTPLQWSADQHVSSLRTPGKSRVPNTNKQEQLVLTNQLRLLEPSIYVEAITNSAVANKNITPEEKAWRINLFNYFFEKSMQRSPDILFVLQSLKLQPQSGKLTADTRNEELSNESEERQRGYDTVFDDTYATTGRGITGPVPKSKLIKAKMGEAEAICLYNMLRQTADKLSDSFNLYLDGDAEQKARARQILLDMAGFEQVAEMDKLIEDRKNELNNTHQGGKVR